MNKFLDNYKIGAQMTITFVLGYLPWMAVYLFICSWWVFLIPFTLAYVWGFGAIVNWLVERRL